MTQAETFTPNEETLLRVLHSSKASLSHKEMEDKLKVSGTPMHVVDLYTTCKVLKDQGYLKSSVRMGKKIETAFHLTDKGYLAFE